MRVLLAGGIGFIGSHVTVELLKIGHEAIIVDNLVNSHIEVLDNIFKLTSKKPIFYNIDLTKEFNIEEEIDIVIHLAGLKSVADSITRSLEYYQTNLTITFNLLNFMERKNINKLIFSSSATVYGNAEIPITTRSITGSGIANPYGKTKYFIEEILRDYCVSRKQMQTICLRYFNPIGNLPFLTENPKSKPNNIVPVILRAIKENAVLKVFGNDYKTRDGTAVRDYIHVVDLANCHCQSLDKFKEGFQSFNVGTGKGTSVMELIELFDKNGVSVKYEIVDRRQGDLPEVYCIPDDFKTTKTVEDAVKDVINSL